MWTPDPAFMWAALEEARKGAGRTHPNPCVGAVVVREGRIVGRGYHEGPGCAHAEVAALGDAGEMSRGADLYVTLEPCCTTGRTGPCTAAIGSAGISRVAAAILDPNPAVNGSGMAALRSAGLVCRTGLLEGDGLAVDPAYHSFYRRGRPFVHLKWAQTLDGRAAVPGGSYLTGEEARRRVHHDRFLSDALLVSASTVVTDDPLLTVRLDGKPKSIVRVILDGRSRITGRERIFSTCPEEGPIWVVRPEGAPAPAFASREGACVLPVRLDAEGHCPLGAVLEMLKGRSVMGVYVEAAGSLSSAFLREGLVDRVSIHIAEKLVGTGVTATEGPVSAAGLFKLDRARWERAGEDWVVTAELEDPCSPA